jgi:carbonyl reductase 1
LVTTTKIVHDQSQVGESQPICPGLVDTATSRPWFADFSQARTPAQAAAGVLDFVLADPIGPATYGELVRDGKVLPWLSGTPSGTHTTATN